MPFGMLRGGRRGGGGRGHVAGLAEQYLLSWLQKKVHLSFSRLSRVTADHSLHRVHFPHCRLLSFFSLSPSLTFLVPLSSSVTSCYSSLLKIDNVSNIVFLRKRAYVLISWFLYFFQNRVLKLNKKIHTAEYDLKIFIVYTLCNPYML